MACTLLQTPSVGVSDWTNFITQVEYQRRGFMAVTYTNPAASAESAIAAGSLVEVAGSIYQFTETAIDYTGGGSTSSDLYIYIKPDAAVSTATVVAWGSAPVWVDAKQGFYASAASTTRCMGGMYVGTAGSYEPYCKYIYNPNMVLDLIRLGETRPLLKRSIQMGEWNMDSFASLTIIVMDSLWTKIRTATAVINKDTGGFVLSPYVGDGGTAAGLSIVAAGNTALTLNRLEGGIFNSTTYDGTASTIPNRGYVYIEYRA